MSLASRTFSMLVPAHHTDRIGDAQLALMGDTWWTSSVCTGRGGKWRSPNHTTAQESACPSPQPEVTISVSALLKLSPWCQRRFADQPGEVVGSSRIMLPPVCSLPHFSSPEHAAGATVSGLGTSASGDSAAAESNHGADHRPAPPPAPGRRCLMTEQALQPIGGVTPKLYAHHVRRLRGLPHVSRLPAGSTPFEETAYAPRARAIEEGKRP
jgi:hypothetical protein